MRIDCGEYQDEHVYMTSYLSAMHVYEEILAISERKVVNNKRDLAAMHMKTHALHGYLFHGDNRGMNKKNIIRYVYDGIVLSCVFIQYSIALNEKIPTTEFNSMLHCTCNAN